jgi:hypothetical protein
MALLSDDMSRGLVAAVAAVVVIGGAAFWLHRPRTEPKEVVTAAPDSAPRIVPKKAEPPAPVVTRPDPKKESRKTAEAPAAPAPAPADATLASLTLESDVPGASVFIDRQFVGNTPLKLDKLEPGSKRIQLTATGFDSVQKTIELNPGANNISVRIKEVSLNAKANVVHKHGMGSCEGTLTATLDGLQYSTSNKGDAFNLRYVELETFAVDYLDKNLRVKQKGGKTWNFTDKNNNADALFVFHRDVEAARKKLAAGYARGQ